MKDTDALIVVDMQNDFCEKGALAVPGGDNYLVGRINKLMREFDHVVLTQDWHPAKHISFASQHEGKQPFDTIELRYGQQTLWPDHCIAGSMGSAFKSGLFTRKANVIIRKGCNPEIDSYSAFQENDRKTFTGLGGWMRERLIKHVYVCGLALDYCVWWTALDAARLGWKCTVLLNTSAALAEITDYKALEEVGVDIRVDP